MNNFYETLGVSHKATFKEIDHVYNLQVKHYNPDYGISLDDITLAYKTLINPEAREAYDLYISQDQNNMHFEEEEEDEEVIAERERRKRERGKKRYEENYDYVNEEFFSSW